MVLQALYEIDSTGHLVKDVIDARLASSELSGRAQTFIVGMVEGVLSHQNLLDDMIHHYAPEWPVDQMAIVDRNILRIAIFEIVHFGETPVKVAINEAVELAKVFGSDNAPRFVNGVLGTVVDSLENADPPPHVDGI
jgi:N utilization substance protein B